VDVAASPIWGAVKINKVKPVLKCRLHYFINWIICAAKQ